MRDAHSRNLSLEADQLVTGKFIQGVLSLRLPHFEVAPFHLGLSVRDRAHASLPVLYVHARLYFCVCTRGSEREGACLYQLWGIQGRPFMFCQPAVKQLPIKAALNSAVIPIPASQFGVHHFGMEGGVKHQPLSSL